MLKLNSIIISLVIFTCSYSYAGVVYAYKKETLDKLINNKCNFKIQQSQSVIKQSWGKYRNESKPYIVFYITDIYCNKKISNDK